MSIEMKLVAGLDIGNGYVKGVVKTAGSERTFIDFPSSVAYVTRAHDIKSKGEEVGAVIDDIFNEMDVNFDSPVVKDVNRVLFGKRGLHSGVTPYEFDVYSPQSKAEVSLNYMLALGSLAGKALQAYWAVEKKLPDDVINATCDIAVALPIEEYKGFRQQYADNFTANTHMVNIHNFETPVRVQLKIRSVQVLAEGASAQYAITLQGEPLMNAMLADLRKYEPGFAAELTAADILSAKNTIGIDIGEGTVNFPVFQNGKFNPDVSMTLSKGYGNVLTEATELLKSMGMPFNSRKALADYLQTTPTAVGKARYNKAARVVDETIVTFAKEVEVQFARVMNRAGSYAEVVYVYGGGATPVKQALYPLLLESVRRFGGEDVSYPVLYLDSRYSRVLNREGLYLVAEKYAGYMDKA